MNRYFIYPLYILLVFCSCNQQNSSGVLPAETISSEKIISLNAAITELIYAAGAQDRLVAVDAGSTYPEATKQLPSVGSTRQMNVESILATPAKIILCVEGEVNDAILAQLKAAGKAVIVFPKQYSMEGTLAFNTAVLSFLGKGDNAELLNAKLKQDFGEIIPLEKKPKVLFIYARGKGLLMVGGKETPLGSFIELSGAENVANDITGYKPFSAEALIAYNPDVILMFDEGQQSLGSADGVWTIEGMSKTNAGKNKNLIVMPSSLIATFGPRLGEALKAFNLKLHDSVG